MANATDELTLLERVFFRIGSAETDEQLQSAVSKFLPPVLLKLSSQQDGVRKKVMELLVHINKRIKSRPLVQLPVEALLLQYQDPSASSFVTNFTIIYIKLGYPRLPIAKQAELVPCILNALEGKPQSHQDSLLLILMPVLGHVTVPSDPKKRSTLFGLNERPHIAKMLSDFMLDVLLLPYGASVQQEQASQAAGGSSGGASGSGASGSGASGSGTSGGGGGAVGVPLGMSEYSFKRVTGDNPMKPEDLETTKLGIVKLLSSGVLSESDIVVHLIVAAADTRFNVANTADMELKKIVSSLDWGSPALLAPLYQLFLGTQLLASKARPPPPRPELRRQPVGTRIRLKILPHLCRTRGPALMFPACIQVFFDSLYGANTSPRLKKMALQFAMLIILGSSVQRLSPVAGVLLSGLLKLIAEDEGPLKPLAYSAAGKLGSRVPSLVNRDLALLQTFFDALSQECSEARWAVREALLSLVDAFGAQPQGPLMEALLAGQVEGQEPTARFVAVRYAATLFPPAHAPARYLLLLATGDSADEVSAEALKALFATHALEPMPPFEDMVNLVADKANARMHNTNMRHVFGNHTLPFSPDTFTVMVQYLHRCLCHAARVPLSALREPHAVPVLPLPHSPLLGRHLERLQGSAGGRQATERYVALTTQLLSASPSAPPLSCLLETVGAAPRLLAPTLTDRASWIKGFLGNSKEKMREVAAQLYGVVAAHGLNEQQFDTALKDLMAAIKGKSLEVQHGSALALAHALERRAPLNLARSALHKEAISMLVSLLSSTQPLLLGAACTGIGVLGSQGGLPLPDGADPPASASSTSSSSSTSSTSAPMIPGQEDKLGIVKRLQDIMHSPKLPTKVKERAALALGLLCVGERFPHARRVMQAFLNMGRESRDVEMHLTVGEALVSCVKGPAAIIARDAWSQLEEEFAPPPQALATSDGDLAWLLEQLSKMASDTHPNARQACCVWLLAAVKHCAGQQPLTDCLDRVQAIFMDMLSENNDVVQDAASKGLGLVYECGGPEARSRLVAALLDQLASGRPAATKVTADTKLFEEGQLGQAPTGGNLSTYKELCSLASDLNQPDLIYKFMHLANHNAIWNSKKGAAFGFSSIAASAGEQLAPHLSKIVPRLYRYQYDPTPRIQASMSSIWKALVPEPSKTLELYHAEVLNDLVENLTNGQWRVRISCCLALSDLMPASYRPLKDSVGAMPRLWSQLFRVMDDVHEGTRQAAGNTARSISKLVVRCCEANPGKVGEEVMCAVLPVLLHNGIMSTVPEVRSVSLQTVSQLVGVAGPLLKPHLHLLIPALLEAASEMEVRGLSQLSMAMSGQQGTQERVDAIRASAAKSHYATETVTKCVQWVDAGVLEALMPRVIDLLKGAVGLATRVASAHLITLLSVQLKTELQPHTGKLLATLVNGLLDRNPVVRKHFASAIGHLVSTAKESSVEKLFAKIRQWYFEKEDDAVRCALAYTLQSIAQRSPELVKEHASVALPLAFLAMHAPKPAEGVGSGVDAWEEVWQEATPGTEGGLRQHSAAICQLLHEALDSSSWTMKAQAANAAATVASKLGGGLEQEQRAALVSVLVSGLGGRTWAGKESLLRALATLCSSCKEGLQGQEESGVVLAAVLRECRKEQLAYRRHALLALGDVVAALEADCFDQVFTIVQDVLSQCENGHAEDDSSRQEQLLQLREAAFEALGKAWPAAPETQARYQERLLEQCVSQLASSTRPVQVAMVAALRCYVAKLHLLAPGVAAQDAAGQELLSRLLQQVSQALTYALGVAKHARLKKEALNVLFLLIKKLQEAELTQVLAQLRETMEQPLEEAARDPGPEIRSRVVDIQGLLKP